MSRKFSVVFLLLATLLIASFAEQTNGDENYKLRVAEQDGSPTAFNVKQIKVPNGSLTDNAGGTVSIAFAGNGSGFTNLNASNLATGTVTTTLLAEDVARTASVTVPTASVLTLNTTPYTLVAAPGAGKIILVDEITCKLVFNSVAYTGSNALELRYTNGSGAKVTADLASSFLNSSSGTNYATVKSVVTALTPVANSPIVLFVPTANPGVGNSDLVFKIKYRIVTP
jgi:hypothetical protein